MDFLKWLFNACFIIALMFLGIKSEPKDTPSDNDTLKNPSTVHRLILK